VTPADVLAAVPAAAAHGFDVVQVDDGHQASIGEWRTPSAGWGVGAGAVAAQVRERGMRAGIWTAPFLVSARGAVARSHPDWLVRDGRGRALGAMHHPGMWGGWALALDTTHPAVLDHLAGVFGGLVDDGFDYFKCDFLYAAALAGRRHDPTATRAEALRRGLEAIRTAIGDRFLLACGCPLGPAAGVVDAMRVSTDVGPRWARRERGGRDLAGFRETESGVRNAVRASVLRAPLHGRLWLNDPDCLLLRRCDTTLTAAQRALLADVVAATGGFTVVSDDLAGYGAEEWATVERVRAAGRRPAPVDLVDPFAPAPRVRSAAGELEIDWSGDGACRWVTSHG
jgi:alpha-galactosidase